MYTLLGTRMEVLADASISPPTRLDVTQAVELGEHNTIRVELTLFAVRTATNQVIVTHEASNDREQWAVVTSQTLGNGVDSAVGYYLLDAVTSINAKYYRANVTVADEDPGNSKGAMVSLGVFASSQ